MCLWLHVQRKVTILLLSLHNRLEPFFCSATGLNYEQVSVFGRCLSKQHSTLNAEAEYLKFIMLMVYGVSQIATAFH